LITPTGSAVWSVCMAATLIYVVLHIVMAKRRSIHEVVASR
jgi:hypothetical protein